MARTKIGVLKAAGQLLFGAKWAPAMAVALGRSERTVRYWLDGIGDGPTAADWVTIRDLLEQRQAKIAQLLKQRPLVKKRGRS